MKTCRLKVEAQSGCTNEQPKSADTAVGACWHGTPDV